MKLLKLFWFAMAVATFFFITLPLFPFFLVYPHRVRSVLVRLVSLYSRAMLRILNVKVSFSGLENASRYKNHLIVSNHLSYLDILLLSGRLPSCFVTSLEMKQTFFLGQLVSLSGCLFVNRRNKFQIRKEILELKNALSYGHNVTIFPEATSTNGDGILKFKRPLFESSLITGRPILPVTINYVTISGNKAGPTNRDIVCWYGDMDFFPHFMRLLGEKEITAEVVISPPLLPETMPSLELAQKSYETILKFFRPLNS